MTSANPEVSRAWLVGQHPADVDARIQASLKSQLGVGVNVSKEWRFPEKGRPYQVPTSAGLTGLSTESYSAALERVEAAFTPIDQALAEKLVAQMHAVLARRNVSEEASEVAFDLYVHVLMQHPADVATFVVQDLCTSPREDGRTGWFPTPPEIEAKCREMEADRVAVRFALRSWKEPDPHAVEVDQLEQVYRQLRAHATEASTRVGPGPASDDGPRGERIEVARIAEEAANAAKLAWLAAQKKKAD